MQSWPQPGASRLLGRHTRSCTQPPTRASAIGCLGKCNQVRMSIVSRGGLGNVEGVAQDIIKGNGRHSASNTAGASFPTTHVHRSCLRRRGHMRKEALKTRHGSLAETSLCYVLAWACTLALLYRLLRPPA